MKENLKQILKLNKEDYLAFVNNYISSVKNTSDFMPSYSIKKYKSINTFFDENCKILSDYAPLVLDDNSAYFTLFDTIKDLSNNYDLSNELEVDKLCASAVQKAVFTYFGNKSPSDTVRTIMYRTAYKRECDLSISEFKGTNNSMCVERSALAQNFFKMLGYDSAFASGTVFLNGNKDCHTFNAVKFSDGVKIFDLVCTPTLSLSDMPSPIMCGIESVMGQTILNGGEMENLNLPPVNFTSQKGNNYVLSYGNADKYEFNNDDFIED